MISGTPMAAQNGNFSYVSSPFRAQLQDAERRPDDPGSGNELASPGRKEDHVGDAVVPLRTEDARLVERLDACALQTGLQERNEAAPDLLMLEPRRRDHVQHPLPDLVPSIETELRPLLQPRLGNVEHHGPPRS